MLLKGVNKRVIVIKNPESEIFEEAYFIVKNKSLFRQARENEMVLEANRIIADYSKQRKISAGFASENKNNKTKNSIGSQKDKSSKKSPDAVTAADSKHDETDTVDLDDDFLDDIYFFTENNQSSQPKSYPSQNFDADSAKSSHDSDFEFVSSKKLKGTQAGYWGSRRFQAPPKSFFAGIGVMSAIIIAARVIEFIVR